MIPILTSVLVLGAIVILVFLLFSQTIHKYKSGAPAQRQPDLDAPQYFKRYRATP